jgi:hypothetical protein
VPASPASRWRSWHPRDGHRTALIEKRDGVYCAVVQLQKLLGTLLRSSQRIADAPKLPETAIVPSAETASARTRPAMAVQLRQGRRATGNYPSSMTHKIGQIRKYAWVPLQQLREPTEIWPAATAAMATRLIPYGAVSYPQQKQHRGRR